MDCLASLAMTWGGRSVSDAPPSRDMMRKPQNKNGGGMPRRLQISDP